MIFRLREFIELCKQIYWCQSYQFPLFDHFVEWSASFIYLFIYFYMLIKIIYNNKPEKRMNSSAGVVRKFSVEFVDSFEHLKQKTSDSKKTCRALVGFFTELSEIEHTYGVSLSGLAKNGSNSMLGASFSLLDYKNREESYGDFFSIFWLRSTHSPRTGH